MNRKSNRRKYISEISLRNVLDKKLHNGTHIKSMLDEDLDLFWTNDWCQLERSHASSEMI